MPRSTCSTAARRASPSDSADGQWQVNQWLKKAVLLSFRLNDMSVIAGGPGKAAWWDKVPLEIRRLGRGALPRGGLPRRAGLRRAPLRLYRAGRRADAVLRQSRRLCRFRHHGRHLGDGRLLRADRQELPHLRRRRHRRRARAAAGRPGHHRGQLLHRRALGSGRGRRSCATARCCRWASSSAPRPRSSTARPARSLQGEVPAYSVVVPGTLPGKKRRRRRLYCAVIVKRVDEKTRSKTSINELLRD